MCKETELKAVCDALKNQLAAVGVDADPRVETYNGWTFICFSRLSPFTEGEVLTTLRLIPGGVFAFYDIESTCALDKVKAALAL